MNCIRRNRARFPPDFMFRLTRQEADGSRSQIATLKRGQNIKYLPLAFTEQGVAMLSSVLRSDRAVRVNIEIMRAFVRLREMVSAHKELAAKLAELEGRIDSRDAEVRNMFDAIREWMAPAKEPARRIGFQP